MRYAFSETEWPIIQAILLQPVHPLAPSGRPGQYSKGPLGCQRGRHSDAQQLNCPLAPAWRLHSSGRAERHQALAGRALCRTLAGAG